MDATIMVGDALAILRTQPAESVQCVVTSPPYWGLRDYGVDGQIGLEETFDEFLAKLVAVFAEVRRVLRSDGVCWVNMGDGYATGTNAPRKPTSLAGDDVPAGWSGRCDATRRHPEGLKAKDLIGQPWRLAFALQAQGWYLRSDCIWHKPNPMPESVTDRPTKSHEYVFLLTKAARYYYDSDAVRTEYVRIWDAKNGGSWANPGGDALGKGSGDCHSGAYPMPNRGGANLRTVWTIATQPFRGAHFATFPEALAERCLLAGSRVGDIVLDPFTGSGTTGAVAVKLGRNFIGTELNPTYAEMARKRITDVEPMFTQAKVVK